MHEYSQLDSTVVHGSVEVRLMMLGRVANKLVIMPRGDIMTLRMS